MPHLVTLTNLREMARLDAEIPESLTDAKLDIWINSGIREFDRFMASCNVAWRRKSTTITASGSTDVYSLPSDFLFSIMLRASTASGPQEMREISPQDIGDYDDLFLYSAIPVYLLGESTVTLRPKDWAGTITIDYVPVRVALVNGTDSFDAHTFGDQFVSAYVGEHWCRSRGEPRQEASFKTEQRRLKVEERKAQANLSREPKRVKAACRERSWPLNRRGRL